MTQDIDTLIQDEFRLGESHVAARLRTNRASKGYADAKDKLLAAICPEVKSC